MAIDIARLMVKVGADISDLEEGLSKADSRVSKSLDKMSSVGMGLTLGLSMPLAGVGVASLKTAADFETTGNVLQAVSDASAESMDRLRKRALELGKDTSFSAGDAMQGMLELSKAGLSTENVYDGISGTLKLAAAAGVDVGTAAEIASNAMNTFGLSGAEVDRVADILAATANSSSVEIADIADSFQMAGALAASAGVPIEDLATAIGVLGNQGVKGSDAGTSLKQMLLQLQAPSTKAAKTMSQIGFSAYDSTGKMKNMRTIVGELGKATKGMTQEERDFALATIFGSDAVRSANILLSKGVEGYDAMAKSVGTSGAASEVADAKTRGLSGAIEYFTGTLETLMVQGGTPWLDQLSSMIRGAADLIGKFGDLSPATQQWAVKLGVAAIAAGPVLFVTSKLVGGFKDIVTFAGKAGGAVKTAADKLMGEKSKFDDLAKSAGSAAESKDKLTDSNKKLADAAGKTASAVGGETDKVGGLGDKAAEGAGKGVATGLGQGIGGAIAGAIGGIIGKIGIGPILAGLGKALVGVASAVGGVLFSTVGLVAAAIVGVIAAAIAIWQNWDAIRDFFGEWGGKIGGWIGDGLGAIGGFVGEWAGKIGGWIGDGLGKVGKTIGDIFGNPWETGRKIGTALKGIWTWISTELGTWPGKIGGALGGVLGKVGEVFGGILGKVGEGFGSAWAWIEENVPTWPGKIGEFIGGILGKIGETFGGILGAVSGGFTLAWNWIATETPTWPGRIWEFISSLPGKFVEVLSGVKDKIVEWFGLAWSWISTEVPSWPGKIGDFFATLPEKVGKFFEDMKKGVEDILNNLIKSAGELAGKILSALTAPFSGIGEWFGDLFGGIGEAMFGPGQQSQQSSFRGLAYASGTPYHHGGLALVGEQGPELVSLPRGSRVYTASETQRQLAPITVNINGSISSQIDVQAMAYQIARQIQTRQR